MSTNLGRTLLGYLVLNVVVSVMAVGPVWAAAPSTDDHLAAGLHAYERGAFEEAAARLAEAVRAYDRAGKRGEQVAALIHLAQAHSALGRHTHAVTILEEAFGLAQRSGDARATASIDFRLGSAHLALGQLDSAEMHLRRGLDLGRARSDDALAAGALNELGNLFATRKRYPESIAAYRESALRAARGSRDLLAARALTNLVAVLPQSGGKPDESAMLLASARDHLKKERPSHDVAFTLMNIGLAYHRLRSSLPQAADRFLVMAAAALQDAATMSERLDDRRGASYAWGHLGSLYEGEGRYADALRLTRRARWAAQQVNAPEAIYRWEWQTGRLLKRIGSVDPAIEAYRRAVSALQSIRPELSSRYRDPERSFRDALGPLYFELVDLLLQRAASGTRPDDAVPYLTEARDIVELFKVAELRDYFRDDCVDTALSKVTKLDVVSQTAVVVYPILLADRTELLVSLPSGLKRFLVPVGADAVTQEVRQFRRRLEKRTTHEYLPHAQQLYAWFIRPLEAELAIARIETLVFVPDGPLRTIPMGALHDGTQFLVAKFALATTPGLSLTEPRPINRDRTRVLAAGVTEAVQGFPALPSVADELQALQKIFPITALVDGQFRLAAFEKKLKEEQFTIVHIASHGQFGGEADKNFVLTFDEKLTMDRLDQFVGLFKFRDDPLELLTLSACETAEGDDRAALGLAGLAVKAGARSALATLWNINDPVSAEMIADFYRHLQDPATSRAVALQRAQIKMLSDPRYDHPGFWAPFLLINNWL